MPHSRCPNATAGQGGCPRSLLALLMVSCAVAGACAEHERAETVSVPAVDPFEPIDEPALAQSIERARAAAREGDRRVLLVFIADWCEDCHEVVRLSRREPARQVLAERYEVVYVEVGRFDRHRALIDEHGIDRIAALVVLDPVSGARLARTTLEPMTGRERGLDADELATWLRDPTDQGVAR